MTDLKIIDNQTLKLVDYLIEKHETTGTNLDLTSDYAFGVKFYPHNKYILTHMRGKEVEGGKGKHAPHPLIINIGKAFHLDFNYFYDANMQVEDAFLTTPKSSPVIDESPIEDIFDEIENKLKLFSDELHTTYSKDMKEYIEETLSALKQINTRFTLSYTSDEVDAKRIEINRAYDGLISLCRKNIVTISKKESLKEEVTEVKSTLKKHEEQKNRSDTKIQQLDDELRACQKLLLEAKNGETDALRQLIALQSNR